MEEKSNSLIPTSTITFVETEHGRLRRRQRAIGKKDLQRAKKWGVYRSSHSRPNGNPTALYTYNNIVYVTDEITGEEVTSYAIPISLEPVPISSDLRNDKEEAVRLIQSDKSKWKSNTVIVIDTSGSMRQADVWGSRTRLDAVWLSVAMDFIATRIESGAAGLLDVVSVITFGTYSQVLALEQPTSWVLYNKFVELYSTDSVMPHGHGHYIPSLEYAESLLLKNSNASCAMGLSFISDGRPSDKDISHITERVESLAKRFGRRLTFHAIGVGSMDEFETLQEMVKGAEDFGAKAEMLLPCKTTSSLGDVFQSFATSLTTTQTEITNVATLKQHSVQDVTRESRTKAKIFINQVSSDEFRIYPQNVVNRRVFAEYFEAGWKRCHVFKSSTLQRDNAKFVAIHKEVFGEGAERFAYRFYELGFDGKTIVGKPLVAKESRFVVERGIDDEKARMDFALSFCKTQQLARRIAEEFNAKMDNLNRVDDKTPRVSFLDCSVYRLDGMGVLVEERLDHTKWQKWNSNNGFVEGMDKVPNFTHTELQNVMHSLERTYLNTNVILNNPELTAIEEDQEEDDELEKNHKHDLGSTRVPIVFTPSEVAQAFSHFSYWATGKKRLICDLQGVYDEKENKLKFTDPVIHYYNRNKDHRRCVHGRTDKGRDGMAIFHATHKDYCNKLCFLVNNGFKVAKKRSSNRFSGVNRLPKPSN